MIDKIYNGWLVSNSFWKRALAVWGHFAAVQIIIYLVLIGLAFLLGFKW